MRTRPVTELRPWEQNPFTASTDGAARVSDNVELLGPKLEPLVAMPDGLLLSGSRRIQLYLEKGIDEVPCTEVDFYQSTDLWGVIVEGDRRPAVFKTKEDAMMYVCMACNNTTGFLDPDKFANVEGNYDLDWNGFAFNTEDMPSLQDMIDNIAPEETEDKQFKRTVIVVLDSEEKQQALYNDLIRDGFQAKVKTTLSKTKK